MAIYSSNWPNALLRAENIEQAIQLCGQAIPGPAASCSMAVSMNLMDTEILRDNEVKCRMVEDEIYDELDATE